MAEPAGKITGLSGKALEDRIFFYLALHDLGKFATGFQNLRPDLLRRMQQRESDKGYIERHDTLGSLNQASPCSSILHLESGDSDFAMSIGRASWAGTAPTASAIRCNNDMRRSSPKRSFQEKPDQVGRHRCGRIGEVVADSRVTDDAGHQCIVASPLGHAPKIFHESVLRLIVVLMSRNNKSTRYTASFQLLKQQIQL